MVYLVDILNYLEVIQTKIKGKADSKPPSSEAQVLILAFTSTPNTTPLPNNLYFW